MLDGQIRNAPPRIQLIRRDNRLCRANRDARLTLPTMLRDRSGFRQRQIGVNLPQKKPRPRLATQQIGVLPHPPQPRVNRYNQM